jgi:lipopolysaccharide/colanic/teichoic acid biosynthesis glycosyltransferase
MTLDVRLMTTGELTPARTHELTEISLQLKRFMDIVGASLLLLLTAPLLAAIALLISLDGGPVIYRHPRIGRKGAPFNCLKFRTMIVGAEDCLSEYLALNPEKRHEWETEQKLKLDPRVTGIGQLLRRLSLDELPQLANVVLGHMSLVGPRPVTQAELDERYGTAAPAYLSVRPGITGLWQISGRNDISYNQRVHLDCQYAIGNSLRMDAVILLRTASAVMSRRGAR